MSRELTDNEKHTIACVGYLTERYEHGDLFHLSPYFSEEGKKMFGIVDKKLIEIALSEKKRIAEEKVKRIAEELAKQKAEDELEAIAKEKKIAKLKAELEELEV